MLTHMFFFFFLFAVLEASQALPSIPEVEGAGVQKTLFVLRPLGSEYADDSLEVMDARGYDVYCIHDSNNILESAKKLDHALSVVDKSLLIVADTDEKERVLSFISRDAVVIKYIYTLPYIQRCGAGNRKYMSLGMEHCARVPKDMQDVSYCIPSRSLQGTALAVQTILDKHPHMDRNEDAWAFMFEVEKEMNQPYEMTLLGRMQIMQKSMRK